MMSSSDASCGKRVHEDSNEYWRDDGSIYDVKTCSFPKTPSQEGTGLHQKCCGDFLPRDGEEPNCPDFDENSNFGTEK